MYFKINYSLLPDLDAPPPELRELPDPDLLLSESELLSAELSVLSTVASSLSLASFYLCPYL